MARVEVSAVKGSAFDTDEPGSHIRCETGCDRRRPPAGKAAELLSDHPGVSGRIYELDGFRGVWAVLILVFHATQFPSFFGWSRVDLFFVLSGYLVARNLIKPGRRQPGLGAALAHRLLRLLPAYYLLVLMVTVLDRAWPVQGGHSTGLLAAVTLTQNVPLYWSGSSWDYCPRYLANTWTLAVELQFSVLVLVLHRLVGTAFLVPLALALLVNSVLLRADGLHPWTLLGRGDGFALGMLLALLLGASGRSGRRSTRLGLLLAVLTGLGYVGWFLVGPEPVPEAFDRPLGVRESLAVLAMDLIYAGLVGLTVCHAGHPVLGPLRAGWLVRLGGLSYGIYLYNFVAIDRAEFIVSGISGVGLGWAVPLAVLLAVVAAAASRAAVERPLQMRFGRPRRAEGNGPPSPVEVAGRESSE